MPHSPPQALTLSTRVFPRWMGASLLCAGVLLFSVPCAWADLFQPRAQYPSGGPNPFGIAILDYNGDHKPDLVIGNTTSDSLSLLPGDGHGHFGAPVNYLCGAGPRSFAIGDFNGDGLADIAVDADGGPPSSYVGILLGKPGGLFAPVVLNPTAIQPYAVAAADLDGDAILDLALACKGANQVSLLIGNGDGTFKPYTTLPSGLAPYSIAIGDFDSDGRPDLVVGNQDSHDVMVYLNLGGGAFAAPVSSALAGPAYTVVTADLNSDGILDLAAINGGVGSISVLLGHGSAGLGDGTFAAPVGYSCSPGAVSGLVIADMDGDGVRDIGVTNNSSNVVNVLLGNGPPGHGNGTFSHAAPFSYSGGNYPFGVVAGDLNGDALVDLAVVDFLGSGATILLNGLLVTATELADLSVQPGNGYVDIGWNYFGGPATVFEVLRSETRTGAFAPVAGEVRAGSASGFSFRDVTALPGHVYFYEIGYRDGAAWKYSGVLEAATLAARTGLRLVSPNPSRGGVEIAFELATPGLARLEVFDASGARVRQLHSGILAAGPGVASWNRLADDGQRARSGVYFVRLASGGLQFSRKIVLLP